MARLTGNYLSDLLATPGLTHAQRADIVFRFVREYATRYPGKDCRLPGEAVAALALADANVVIRSAPPDYEIVEGPPPGEVGDVWFPPGAAEGDAPAATVTGGSVE